MRLNRWFWPTASIGAVICAGALGYHIGSRDDRAADQAVPTQQAEAPKAKEYAAFEPVKRAEPTFRLRPILTPDYDHIGMGCACAFSQERDAIVAAGHEAALIRPNNKLLVAPLGENDFERLYADDAQFQVGGYAVWVKGRGEAKPLFDGHEIAATLTVAGPKETRKFEGKWACGC